MPNNALSRDPLWADVRQLRPAVQNVAYALRTGNCPPDRFFDCFLPDELRVVSEQYWTPLVVAKRVADWLDHLGVRTVVDIGSGAGKFCVAAALVGDCSFIGLEERPLLVASARRLASAFGLQDRVSFVEGALGAVPTPNAEAYYLYNPFGPYWFGPGCRAETEINCSEARFARDVATVERILRRAPVGTYVVTYNGFGGRMPRSYQQLRIDQQLPATLRLWRK